MIQITARVPDEIVSALDEAAKRLRRSRAQLVREALERYLADYDDLSVALDRIRDPSDPVLGLARRETGVAGGPVRA